MVSYLLAVIQGISTFMKLSILLMSKLSIGIKDQYFPYLQPTILATLQVVILKLEVSALLERKEMDNGFYQNKFEVKVMISCQLMWCKIAKINFLFQAVLQPMSVFIK